MRALLLTLTICTVTISAQAKYSGGRGVPNDPYQIATAEDLMLLGETPEDYDKHFILTADIDLDPNLPGRKVFDKAVIAPDEWPLPDTFFTGVFDGNGYTISHLTIKGVGHLGLFGELRIGAMVRDLGIADVNITASDDYTGGLVGINGGALTCCQSTGVVNGREDVGGLVGDNWGTVAQCYSACAVSGGNGIGGLMGENSNGTVNNCYSTGLVLGTGQDGGLMAYNRGAVIHCFWDIQTSGQTMSAGGIGKTTAEMQTATTFLEAGWDFVGETTNGTEDIWKIVEGLDYPRLAWEKYNGGTGEPNDPYKIATAEDLMLLGENPEDYDKHFIMIDDVDLSGYVFDMAVIAPDTDPCDPAFQGIPFKGMFDGNGRTISHLTIQGAGYLGLFGRLDAEAVVESLRLVDANIAGSDYVGALVGFNYGHISTIYTTGTVSGNNRVGGFMGRNRGNVTLSHNAAAVTGNNDVGGITAANYSSITNSYNTGNLAAHSDVGGITGENYGSIAMTYNTGTISGATRAGGLVGYNWQDSIITSSFWDMEASGLTTSDGGIGKTTAEMQIASTFLEAGWDFVDEIVNGTEDIWWIDEGKDYPRLWWETID